MTSPPPRPNYPSIRASCDRCRAKKLACVISAERTETGARQCVRCHRAKACCVFGPRAQNTRRKTALRGVAAAAGADKKPRPLAKAAEPPRPRPREAVLPLTPPPTAPLDGPWVQFPDGLPGLAAAPPTSWFDGFLVGSAGECCGTGFDIHNFCHGDALVLDPFLDPCPLLDFSDSSSMASWTPMDSWDCWGGLGFPPTPNPQQPWTLDGGYGPYKLGAEGGGTSC